MNICDKKGKKEGRLLALALPEPQYVILAAKMLVIAWTLMKKHEPFNPDLLNID